jgi:hypothetical protein
MRSPSVLKREAGRAHEGTGAISFVLEKSDAAHLVRSPSPLRGGGVGVTGSMHRRVPYATTLPLTNPLQGRG